MILQTDRKKLWLSQKPNVNDEFLTYPVGIVINFNLHF